MIMFTRTRKTTSVFHRFASIVLVILYNSLTVYEFLRYVIHKLNHGVRFLRSGCSGNIQHTQNRKPKHIAIVLSELVIRYEDLAKLILWCYEADIRFLTLYEPKGSLKTALSELLRETEKLTQSQFKVNFHLRIPARPDRSASLDSALDEIHVHVAAAEDGRGAVVEAARKLHQIQNRVTIEKVNSMLKVTCDWPEPDLLIRCGGINSHLGFLPWALRLTEFADLYSHHYLFPSEFQDILETFSCSDRRCGR